MQQQFISIPEVQVVLGGLCVALGEVLDAKLLGGILRTLANGEGRSHAEREVFEYLAGCVDGTVHETACEAPRNRPHLHLVSTQ